MSQYLRCGRKEGGASMDVSEDIISVRTSKSRAARKLTRREILLRILIRVSIHLHALLPCGAAPLAVRALALALLREHVLEVLRAPVHVLRVRGVLERPRRVQVRVLLGERLGTCA
jgi:hypothetical protein